MSVKEWDYGQFIAIVLSKGENSNKYLVAQSSQLSLNNIELYMPCFIQPFTY